MYKRSTSWHSGVKEHHGFILVIPIARGVTKILSHESPNTNSQAGPAVVLWNHMLEDLYDLIQILGNIEWFGHLDVPESQYLLKVSIFTKIPFGVIYNSPRSSQGLFLHSPKKWLDEPYIISQSPPDSQASSMGFSTVYSGLSPFPGSQ